MLMYLVFLLITHGFIRVVEGADCSRKIIPKNLNGCVGTIFTPNFPNKFDTPYCEKWVIDAKQCDINSPKYIHLYYTQPYFKYMTPPNFIVQFHTHYPFIDTTTTHHTQISPIINNRITKNWIETTIHTRKNNRIKKNIDENNNDDNEPHPHNINNHASGENSPDPKFRFMSIEVNITSLYGNHFRARDNFLQVYGFNITYEVDNMNSLRDSICTIYICRAAGNCYATHDYKNFFCGCYKGHHGRYCEYGPSCDPEKNINPCLNGGTCKTMASGSVECYCKEGYIGPTCNRRNSISVKACPAPNCLKNCENNTIPTNRPCSCHNGTKNHKVGWIRYEVEFLLTKNSNNTNTTSSITNTIRIGSNKLNGYDFQIKSEIELKLMERLKTKVPGLEGMDRISIISLGRPGSKFKFHFFGPPDIFNDTLDVLHTFYMEEIYPGIILNSLLKFHSIPSLLLEYLSMRPVGTIKVDDNYSITCSAIGSLNITFKWFKDDIPINTSLGLGGRITEMNWREHSSYTSMSTLNFDRAHANDRGVFTCQVSDLDEEQCKDFEMDVLLKPIININPMSLTIIKNVSDIVLTCSATLDSSYMKWDYDWEIDGILIGKKQHKNEIKENLFPVGSLLRIINAEISKTYTCIVINKAGKETMDIRVEVLESENSQSCPKQIHSSLSWEMTAPNQTAKRLCPSGYVGFAQRFCKCKWNEIKPKWIDPDFSKCVSLKLKAIDRSVQNAKLGFTNHTHLSDLVIQMSEYINSNKNFLYLGEGERFISILRDIGKYTIEKKNARTPNFFEVFLNTTSKFLLVPESCFHETSVKSLCNIIYQMVTNFFSLNEFSYTSDALIVQGRKINSNFPLIFTNENKIYSKWSNIEIKIPNNENIQDIIFLFVIIQNITLPVTPREKINSKNPYQLISPLIYINSKNYEFIDLQPIILRFEIMNEWKYQILNQHVYITCGSFDDNPIIQNIPWKIDGCDIVLFKNQAVECHCNRFGQYGLLIYPNQYDNSIQPILLHWTVLFGCITCIISCSLAFVIILIYSHCQIRMNSIYFLKMIICFSLILSILFILSARAENSSIPLTTCVCTFLIISLSCNLTIFFKIFLNSTKIDQLKTNWIQSVPLINILLSITFTCTLPIWTSAAAMLYYSNSLSNDLSFEMNSPIFGSFIIVLSIILIISLSLYTKGTLQLRNNRLLMDTIKTHLIDYRLKTLNRTLGITILIIITILSTILYRNSRTGPIYQYLYGFSTFTMGMVIFFLYTIKSEYPIPNFIIKHICIEPGYPDPEKLLYDFGDNNIGLKNNNRSPEKRYTIKNGGFSSILLQNEHNGRNTIDSSEPETTIETLGGSSICSTLKQTRGSSFASNLKRPSFGSFKTPPHSFTDDNHLPPENVHRFSHSEWRNHNHNHLSNNSTLFGIMNGSIVDRPKRGKCRLLDDNSTSIRIQLPLPIPIHHNKCETNNGSIEDIDDYVKPTLPQFCPNMNPSQKLKTSNQINTLNPKQKISLNVEVEIPNKTFGDNSSSSQTRNNFSK